MCCGRTREPVAETDGLMQNKMQTGSLDHPRRAQSSDGFERGIRACSRTPCAETLIWENSEGEMDADICLQWEKSNKLKSG